MFLLKLKKGFEETLEKIKEEYTEEKLNKSINHFEYMLENLDLDALAHKPDDYEFPVITEGIKEYYTVGFVKEKYENLVDYKKMLNTYKSNNNQIPQDTKNLKLFFAKYFEKNYYAYAESFDKYIKPAIEKNSQIFEEFLPKQLDYKETAQPLTEAEYNNLNPLEKKAVDIVQDMDFEVYSFKDEKGDKFYCLYDLQRGHIYDYSDKKQDFRESEFVVSDLQGLTNILPDNYYEDLGYDIEKVFNDSIKNIQDCFKDDKTQMREIIKLNSFLNKQNAELVYKALLYNELETSNLSQKECQELLDKNYDFFRQSDCNLISEALTEELYKDYEELIEQRETKELNQDTLLESKLSQLSQAEAEQKQRVSENSLQTSSTNKEYSQSQEAVRKRRV